MTLSGKGLARVTIADDGLGHYAPGLESTLCGKRVNGFDFQMRPVCPKCYTKAEVAHTDIHAKAQVP